MERNSIAVQNRIKVISALVVRCFQSLGKGGGCYKIKTDDGEELILEMHGTPRNFPDTAELSVDKWPRDPEVIKANYTVARVSNSKGYVLSAVWDDQGWFGALTRGAWEADLIWALT